MICFSDGFNIYKSLDSVLDVEEDEKKKDVGVIKVFEDVGGPIRLGSSCWGESKNGIGI